MKFSDFLKDKIINISLIVFVLCTIEIFLMIYDFAIAIKIYILVSILAIYFIGLALEFQKKNKYYKNLKTKLEELDQKYLITELIGKSDFYEGKLLEEIITDTNKSMLEHVNYYKNLQEEYKDYIELWIHEVKIPIATSKLIIENNKNEITRNIDEEIDKIEDYTEQALFYARSNNVEKDYIIRKCDLKEAVNTAVKKNKNQLISEKIKVEISNVEKEIYADSKWIVFILNQIIANSIKYSKSNDKKIEITAQELNDKVILYIKDNGIGIKNGEITRVFEKGFTGANGRIIGKKSTGIGLYLCKKLCDKLGIGLELNSEQDVGTEVRMVFPKGSYYANVN